jgi:hypothetical protein
MQHTTRQSRRGMAAHLIGAAAKSIHIAPAAGPAPALARELTCLSRWRSHTNFPAHTSPSGCARLPRCCCLSCRTRLDAADEMFSVASFRLRVAMQRTRPSHASRCGAPSRRSDYASRYASRNGKAHAAQCLRMGMSVPRRRGDGMRSSPPRPRVRFKH